MFKNYLKITLRNLGRRKFYTFINILGLAIGITCSILIGLFVFNELSYDKCHEKHDRIYRMESHFTIQESDDLFAVTAFPLARAIKQEFPHDVEEWCRFSFMDNNLFQYDGNKFFEDNVYYADSTLFDVFTHKFIAGSPEGALNDPNEMVLTESFARKIFGDKNPVGETIDTGYGFGFTITGVIEDVPYNAHLRFEAVGSMITLENFFGPDRYHSLESQAFWNVGFYSYILLKETGNIKNIMDGYPEFNEKYIVPVGQQFGATFKYMITPLTDIHLFSRLRSDLPTGNMAYVYTFSLVALFLLLIGCINYMNMATAQSSNRATEVGIRKVVGAQKKSLRYQFILESILISFLALIIALIAVELLLPSFNQLADRQLSFDILENFNYLLLIIGVTILVGFVSGSYPAFYLSSFIPVKVLKGKLGKSKGTLRKVLVLLQFTISIIMIVGTFTVMQQLNFLKDKDLGFDKDNVMVLTVRDTTGVRNLQAFQDELLRNPQILESTTASSIPGQGYGIVVQRYETADGAMKEKGINFVFAEQNYIDMMNMKIIKGRNFDPDMQTDLEEAVIINEATAEVLGWGDDPISKKLDFGAGMEGEAMRNAKVIGVVKDFHYTSLHNKIDPLIILLSEQPNRHIHLRVRQENMQQTLPFIEQKWNEFCPTFPFEYTFLDDSLNEQYIAEQKIGKVFTSFSVMCIFIACLGLFGLAAYTAEQRTKEISIRKVMGATSGSIVVLLSKEFSIWVILANIIAWPVAYFALRSWLQNFAYAIDQSFFTFILAGITALAIALITVSFRAFKAAQTNPAEALKYE
ncbi:MAG: ABC transporter permease [Candidatus Cloacimonetes bacterium]|nr:ABC transporter permease [Candidatus Cloacimonadota bacterium]MCF7813619.1 ABC transporter permease [Candidatus Cloacimonadota bacterium]MCF7867935.1 ABC transporter permease [Candidatus Cloacimonadota bacterium]MCF7882872.1 ABC transporter permease [Candidatus Cloacimonadota bacterium]